MISDKIIREIRASHQSMLETIDQLKASSRNYFLAKPLIQKFHQQMLNHFGRQDGAFFAPLREHYASDRVSAKTIEFLEFDLKDIKVNLLVFYDKHSGELGDINARSFSKDFSDLSGLITGRIKMEEHYLIPLLKKAAS